MEKISVKAKVMTRVAGGQGFHITSYRDLLFKIFK